MSGLPFPDDEPETPEAAEFRAAINECRRNGWKPLAIVVPTLGRRSPKVAMLALEFDLPVYEDPDRQLDQGIGLRYEADAPDLGEPGFTAAKATEMLDDLERLRAELDRKQIDELLEDGKDGESWRG